MENNALCLCGCGQLQPVHIRGKRRQYRKGHRPSMLQKPERFWRRVFRRGSDECWEWQSYINDSGYGVLRTKKNVMLRAHRVAFELTFGAIPEGHFICHRCDNRKCCNPSHLFVGTPDANVQDMISKGRQSRENGSQGEANGGAKLTDSQVQAI